VSGHNASPGEWTRQSTDHTQPSNRQSIFEKAVDLRRRIQPRKRFAPKLFSEKRGAKFAATAVSRNPILTVNLSMIHAQLVFSFFQSQPRFKRDFSLEIAKCAFLF
jgi:hypothetical protein